MQTAPGSSACTSSTAVSGFMQTRMSISFLRPVYPSLLARMVNHVGSPWMLEGNKFLPLTGMPIWKMERISTELEDWLPEPFMVATWMEKSLTTGCTDGLTLFEAGCAAIALDIAEDPLRKDAYAPMFLRSKWCGRTRVDGFGLTIKGSCYLNCAT